MMAYAGHPVRAVDTRVYVTYVVDGSSLDSLGGPDGCHLAYLCNAFR